MAVARQHGRTGCGTDTRIGDEQIRRHRHGVLGVEDDLVPPVPVALHGLEGLNVQGNRCGLGAEELVQPVAATLEPGRDRARISFGKRILVGGGGQADHPLVPE